MKADLEWTDKPEPGIKRKIRITFLKTRDIKWQFKRSDQEQWDYDRRPTPEEWEQLETKVEALYTRRRIKYEHLELVRKKNQLENL